MKLNFSCCRLLFYGFGCVAYPKWNIALWSGVCVYIFVLLFRFSASKLNCSIGGVCECVYFYNTLFSLSLRIHSRSRFFNLYGAANGRIEKKTKNEKKKNKRKKEWTNKREKWREWIVKCVVFIVRNITAVECFDVIHIFSLWLLSYAVFFIFSEIFSLLFSLFFFLYLSGSCATHTNNTPTRLQLIMVTGECLPENTVERWSVIYSETENSIQYGCLLLSGIILPLVLLFHFHFQR